MCQAPPAHSYEIFDASEIPVFFNAGEITSISHSINILWKDQTDYEDVEEADK